MEKGLKVLLRALPNLREAPEAAGGAEEAGAVVPRWEDHAPLLPSLSVLRSAMHVLCSLNQDRNQRLVIFQTGHTPASVFGLDCDCLRLSPQEA